MSLTLDRGRRYAVLTSIVTPLVVVALAKLAGFGPLASQAMQDESNDAMPGDALAASQSAVVVEAPLELPTGAGASLIRSRDLSAYAAADLANPFYQPPTAVQEPPRVEVPIEAPPPAPPTFILSGVMNGRPPVAVIDGNVHRPGDDLGGGWRVESIDARQLSVTLRHTDGRTHVLSAGGN